jgi:hypothetical protein
VIILCVGDHQRIPIRIDDPELAARCIEWS